MKKIIKILIVDEPHSEMAKSIKEHLTSIKSDIRIICSDDPKVINREYKKTLRELDLDNFQKICEANRKEVETWPDWKKNIVITAETASTGQFIKRKKNKKRKK